MIKTHAYTREKMSTFGWLILETLLLQSYMKVKTFFLKPNTKESAIYLMLREKTN